MASIEIAKAHEAIVMRVEVMIANLRCVKKREQTMQLIIIVKL